jgi:PIN domain nuclease of toxin-antitoxin system
MTLLLDTHVFLWWLDDPRKISAAARQAIGNGRNTVFVSAVVIWEIVIKKSLGKLKAPGDLDHAIAANQFIPLPVTIPHVLALEKLAEHHRDPFDRLLIAQAFEEGLTFITRDEHAARYQVPHILA